jgi:hypothetical protein
MTRSLLVVLCVALFGLAVWGMWTGWRHREARQSDLPALPPVPDDLGPALLEPMTGLYVGTAYASSWQDRVVASGLGLRAAGAVQLYDRGVLVERDGADAIFVPTASIVDAHLGAGLAGKVVGAGGLLVIRWRHGDVEVDSGIRGDDKSAYPTWVRAINERACV